jgi:hypothetical protein
MSAREIEYVGKLDDLSNHRRASSTKPVGFQSKNRELDERKQILTSKPSYFRRAGHDSV